MPTPTRSEYALLSEAVYAAGDANRLNPAAAGWVEVPTLSIDKDGFYGAVYKKGDEYVIAFRGTDGWRVGDFAGANIPAALGLHTSQIDLALQLVAKLQAHKLAQQEPADLSNVSFTGHSLGGGLAAVMAVFFNRPATTFATAPFQNSATDFETSTADVLSGQETMEEYFETYMEYVAQHPGISASAAFQSYVDQWNSGFVTTR